MPLSGQPPTPDQAQWIKDKAAYWRTIGNEARVTSIARLEDAAKQLVGLTTGLQGLYLAVFAISDLRKQLTALLPTVGGTLLLLAFFLPILLWLLSLYSATRVFVPELRPEVNINDLDADGWQDIQRLYEQAAEAKQRWLKRSHGWLIASFAVVLVLLVVFAFLPEAPDAGPMKVILLTPTPTP